MKKVYLYIVPIIFVFLSAFGCPETDTRPPKYPYDPEKAGVEEPSINYLSFSGIELPPDPHLSKDDDFFYILLNNKVVVLDNVLNISDTITIDFETDLSVDMSLYSYDTGNIIVHDDKIVVLSYFYIYQNYFKTNQIVKCLQMDKDGTNKKLITFSEAGYIENSDYNPGTQKILMFSELNSGDRIVFEYTYDNTSDTYIYGNSYDGSTGGIKNNFSINFVYFVNDGRPYGSYSLYKCLYNSPINYQVLGTSKTINLYYLHIDVSDFVVDGDYIWLLSWKQSDDKYKLMKVEPNNLQFN